MKRQPLHLLLLALFAFLFTHCTMEKRLYNRGYHIEHKRTLQTNKTEESETTDATFEAFPSDEFSETDESISENAFLTPEIEETSEVQDSTVLIEPTNVVKDTVYIYDDFEDNLRKKERRLFFTGIPAFALGLLGGAMLLEATAAGATFFEFVVVGAFGWICVTIAAICLLLFLIFLLTPANPETDKTAPEKKEPAKKSKLSKGENAALIVCLVVFGIIGLGFLAANLL